MAALRTPGQLPDACGQALHHRAPRHVILIGRRRERQVDDQQIAGVETRRHRRQRGETAQQETRANQQHQRQPDLRHDQRAAKLPVTHAARRAAAPVLVERFAKVDACSLQRGHEAKDDAGNHRQDHREHRDGPFHANQLGAWQAGHCGTGEQRHAPRRDQQANAGADARQHHALDNQLADEAPASGAHRGADGHLLLAAHGPRQQQVGHVGAGDEQHQRDRAQQQEQRRPHVLHHLILERRHHGAHVAIRFGELLLECERDALQLGTRRLQRHVGSEARDRKDPRVPAAILGQCRHPRAEGHVEVGGLEQFEARRQHADDGVRLVVEQQALSQRAALRIATPRKSIREQHHAFGAWLVIALVEAPPLGRSHTEHGQKRGADHLGRDAFRLAAAADGQAGRAHGADAGERLATRAPVVVVVARGRDARELRRLLGEDHHPGGVLVGERLKQDRVDDGEDGGVRADAQRQRQDGDEREAGPRAEVAKRDAHVLHASIVAEGSDAG